MDGLENGANEFNWSEIEQIFAEEETQQETPPATETSATNPDTQPAEKKEDVTTTKAFAKRLKESTDKARNEEREAIAKSLGFESYDALVKSRETKIMESKGLDPEQVTPVVDELVQKRLNEDPRMKELAEFKKRQIAEFAKKELAELTELTDGEITDVKQLSKEVLDRWSTTGSLKKAYLEVEGVNLITKLKAGKVKGSTDHLQNPTGTHGSTSAGRALTAEERQVWRIFNPGMTDEELNKITVDNKK